jgi:hypothetical protein
MGEASPTGRGRLGSLGYLLVSLATPIKKLPQVGQEPVEAVESRHSSPDGPMIIDWHTGSKDIPVKIPDILAGRPGGIPYFHTCDA